MYSEVILHSHAFVPKAEIKDLEHLRRSFLLKSRYEENVEVKTYAETATHFGLPLHFQEISSLSDNIIDNRSEGHNIEFSMIEGFRLRDNQLPIYNRFCRTYEAGKTGWLLHMITGGGKSLTVTTFIQKIGRTALIIVPRDYLVKQWVENLLKFTTLTKEDNAIA